MFYSKIFVLLWICSVYCFIGCFCDSASKNGRGRGRKNKNQAQVESEHNATDTMFLAMVNKQYSMDDGLYHHLLAAVKQLDDMEVIGDRKMRKGQRALILRTSPDIVAQVKDIDGILRVKRLREKRAKKVLRRLSGQYLVLVNATILDHRRIGKGKRRKQKNRKELGVEDGKGEDEEARKRSEKVGRWWRKHGISVVRKYHVGDIYAMLIEGKEKRIEKLVEALRSRNLTVDSVDEVDGDIREVIPNFVLELDGAGETHAQGGQEQGSGGSGGSDEGASKMTCFGQPSGEELWGLTRIAHEKILQFDYTNRVYGYSAVNGTGVDVYVLDTGVMLSHSQFEGRARHGFTAPSLGDGEGPDDVHGHGTHVAGSVAGRRTGVAKGANIISVKVLDSEGAGPISAMLEGLEYVTEQTRKGNSKPSVINLSLGGQGDFPILLQAVRAVVRSGITAVVAAGNEGADACLSSPAQLEEAITVGSSDDYDIMSSFSNTGSCVDILAPGDGILSASNTGDTKLEVMSGTSMATPYVTGVISVYLSAHHHRPDPEEIRCWLLAKAAANQTVVFDGTPNRLLQCPCLESVGPQKVEQVTYQLSDDPSDTCTYPNPNVAGPPSTGALESDSINAANSLCNLTYYLSIIMVFTLFL